MGLLTFSINVILDGCVDHREGIADDETHAFFTRLMDESGATLWGRVTYEMMESHWPAVARGDVQTPPAMRAWALKLEAKPKYVVSSTRSDFPWTYSHHLTGDLPTGVQKLKDATPDGVLLSSGKLSTELDRLDLIDEYRLLVHPRIAGHGPTLYAGGLPGTRRLAPGLGEAAAQRCRRPALPARALTRARVMRLFAFRSDARIVGGWTTPAVPLLPRASYRRLPPVLCPLFAPNPADAQPPPAASQGQQP